MTPTPTPTVGVFGEPLDTHATIYGASYGTVYGTIMGIMYGTIN